MKQAPNWILGLFIAGSLSILTVATLFLSNIALSPRTDWIAYFGEDSVVQEGTEVLSAGIKVGMVTSVDPLPDDKLKPGRYVRTTISIRKDLTLWKGAELRIVDRGIIGGFIVVLHRGEPGAKQLSPDTPLGGRRLNGAVQELGQLISENRNTVNQIITNIATVTRQIREGYGTLGKLVNDPSVYQNLAETSANLARLSTDLASEDSTLGRLARRPEIYNNFEEIMESVRNVMAQIESGKGTLGSVIMDDRFAKDLETTTRQIRVMVEEIRRGEGTLGLILRDPELRDNFLATIRGARELMDRMGKGGGTLELLMTDSKIFENLMAVSENLREVSADIRQGRGSLGLLLKDETLYREATRLFESFREAGEIARENAPIASLVSFTTLFFSALN